ncbi:MAG: triose-phosphate isomerase [Firmicutes bacterium]|nr:triose-phosphate isomerase [Bacillota bacterium]
MKIVIANWKMHLLSDEAKAFCRTIKAAYRPKEGAVAGIAPPATLLREVAAELAGSGIQVYAQNGHFETKGAFTGEISMPQIQDAGCHGVILGHSERRHIFGETDENLIKKLKAAWECELQPVLCIGETLTQRDAGFTLDVLHTQLDVLKRTGPGPLIIAYEPVWAIGTGRVAGPMQIEEVHAFIHDELWRLWSDEGLNVPIQYGGSVTPDNFEGILNVPSVSGGLVGGASLDPQKFLKLIEQMQATV